MGKEFLVEVSAGLCVVLLSALVLFLYKLPSTLEELKKMIREFMKETNSTLHHHDQRITKLERRVEDGHGRFKQRDQ